MHPIQNNLELMRCIMAKHDPVQELTNSDYRPEAELVLQKAAKHKVDDIAEIIRSVLMQSFADKLNGTLFAERVADDWLTVNMRNW